MRARAFLISGLLLTASCGDAPADDKEAASDVPAETSEQLVSEQKKSIEEAAEAATKLIEADAKAEIDAATAGQLAN